VPDVEHGIHGLLIVNEPDAWLVNLMSNTGHHSVDPGHTFNCHMPVFGSTQIASTSGGKDPLSELEFGQEIDYFRARGALTGAGPVLRGEHTNAYAAQIGNAQVFLFTTGTPERPWALARKQGDQKEIFWYGSYEQIPFEPKLFARPEGVKIEEPK
jgi:hypothetical protein